MPLSNVKGDSLLETWQSLFQSELCSKVQDVPNEIIGPVLLIERTIIAFKEICSNYLSAVKEVGAKNVQLDSVSKELNVLREELHETRKPCENCETLSKELSFAKKRASDAEFRVTQIAKILGPTSDSQEDAESSKSADSPKRKKACLREKENNFEVETNFSSQTVEIGYTEALLSPVLNNDKVSPSKKSPKKSKSPKNKCGNEKTKRLSRSIELENERSNISPRRNLSAEFDNVKNLSPSKKSKSSINPLKPSPPGENSSPGNGPNGSFAEKYGSELDKLWFGEDDTFVPKKNKEVKQTVNCDVISSCSNNKSTFADSIIEYRKRKKVGKPVRSDKVIKNPDNSFDLVLKKEPKKKHIQLTLQMVPTNKLKDKPDSDSDDIVLPSPDKLESKENELLGDDDDLELTFAPGVTSTQKPDDAVPPPLAGRKTPSPTKKRKNPAPSTSKQLDSSFDVVLDKRKTTPSPNYKYKSKTVRGKARANLQGWDCEECKKFYELACKNQSPSKLKAKMNMCSRHRSKHKQTRPPTPPGFWDLDIPDTPE